MSAQDIAQAISFCKSNGIAQPGFKHDGIQLVVIISHWTVAELTLQKRIVSACFHRHTGPEIVLSDGSAAGVVGGFLTVARQFRVKGRPRGVVLTIAEAQAPAGFGEITY